MKTSYIKDMAVCDLNPEVIETTNQEKIRETAKGHLQAIYNQQEYVKGNKEDIEEFLNLGKN